MKIKLNRVLWNHQKDDEFEVNDLCGNWAIGKGYAVQINDEYETKPEPMVLEKKRGRKPNK